MEFTLEVLAWIAADQDRWERAATLSGVLSTLRQTAVMPPEYARVLRHYEDPQARLQRALGPPRFDATAARGAAFSYGEAIAYALEESPPRERPPRPVRRERYSRH